jgi:hypothetical protein
MRISQRELLNESFADIVRGIGAAAKVMATGLVQSYQAVYEPIKAFRSKQPVGALKEALKTTYFNTFDYKTVRIGKTAPLPNDRSGASRISIKFTAKRIKGISRGNTNLEGGYDGPNEYTAILTRDKKGVGGEYRVEIRDQNNNVIAGESDKENKIGKKDWDTLYSSSNLGSTPTVRALAQWIGSTIKRYKENELLELYQYEIVANNPGFPIPSNPTLTQFLVDYLNGPTSTDPVNSADVTKIKDLLKREQLISESNNKSQLNFLKNSYNLVYEVSVNKGN